MADEQNKQAQELTDIFGLQNKRLEEQAELQKQLTENTALYRSFGSKILSNQVKALDLQAQADVFEKEGNKSQAKKLALQAKALEASAELLSEKQAELKIDNEQLAAQVQKEKNNKKALTSLKETLGLTGLLSKLTATLSVAGLGKSLLGVNNDVFTLSKTLGQGVAASRDLREQFEEYSLGNTRIDAERLTQATVDLGQALGTNVLFSNEFAEDFVKATEFIGLTKEAAGGLARIAVGLGQSAEGYRESIANALIPTLKANSINLSLKDVYEEIGKLSASTVVTLGRSPEKLTQAVVQAKRFGLELNNLNGIASSLLDFETSIGAELEAELLTGKQLNLEKARAAALTGDQNTLMREIANAAGSLNEFENMNVLARQSLAQSLGLNVDQMSEMLLKQEAINQLGAEGEKATSNQLRAAQELMKTDGDRVKTLGAALEEIQAQENATKNFEQAVRKLQTIFTDIFSKMEPIIDGIAGMVKGFAESPFAGVSVMAIASVAGLLGALKAFTGLRGAARMFPMFTQEVGIPGAAGGVGDGGATGVKGLSRTAKIGLRAGAAGLVGGMALNAAADSQDPESGAAMGLGVAGSALQYGGTGAMIGSVIPGIGTAVGAGVGVVIGGFMGYLDRKEEREKAESEKKKEVDSQRAEKQEGFLTRLAEREVKLMLDGNRLGQGLAVTNYRVN
jgi:hypothetical protein